MFLMNVQRFLSNSTTAIAIATIMATVDMVKYVPTGACGGIGVGSAVGEGADDMYIAVSANDDQ